MKRSTIAAILVASTALAVLLAVGLNQGVARLVRLPDGATVESTAAPEPSDDGTVADARPARPSGPRVPNKQQYISGILDRNLFDKDAIGRESEGTSAEEQITDLDVRLIGTVVAEPVQFSSALIADGDDGPSHGYGIGDKIKDAEIVKIEPKKVTVKRADGSIETLTLDDTPAPRPSPRPSTPSDGGNEGISQVGDNSYVIDRSLFERYMGDLDAISRMGRAIPHRGPDGEIDGYRLSGVRRRSLGDQVGIKNGDIVHSVNGNPLTSMQGAMAAFSTLQSESSFTFEVTRRGQKQTMEYEIR